MRARAKKPGGSSTFPDNDEVMRYRRAVEKLRELAQACEEAKNWPPEDPFLLEAHVFGDVLRGADPLENVEVALVVNLPPEDVPWGSTPPSTLWLADRLRLSKGSYLYFWRSHLTPVWNHHILGPVRFWSRDGADEAVLTALAERRFGDVARQEPDEEAGGEQLGAELETALSHLRSVHASYWDRDWQREHRSYNRNPEDELWDAVDGYLELRNAAEARHCQGRDKPLPGESPGDV
jgi:hypothetical protein